MTISQTNWAHWIVGQVKYGIPYSEGMPGVGKTMMHRVLAKMLGLDFLSYELSKCAVEDFQGIPFRSTFTQLLADGTEKHHDCMEFLPDRRMIQATLMPCLLLCDEFGSVPHSTQAAALQFICDGVGPQSLIFCAGNPVDQAAAGVELSPPMMNRICLLEWEVDVDGFMEGLASGLNFPAPQIPVLPRNWGDLIQGWCDKLKAFLRDFPELLAEFPKESAQQMTPFPSPRSWTNLAASLAGAESVDANVSVIDKIATGFVGKAAATQFQKWLKEADLPDPEDFLANPGSLQLPARGDLAAAVMSSIVNAVIRNNTSDRWEAAGDCIEIAFGQSPEFAAAVYGRWLKNKTTDHKPRNRKGGAMEEINSLFHNLHRDRSLS